MFVITLAIIFLIEIIIVLGFIVIVALFFFLIIELIVCMFITVLCQCLHPFAFYNGYFVIFNCYQEVIIKENSLVCWSLSIEFGMAIKQRLLAGLLVD